MPNPPKDSGGKFNRGGGVSVPVGRLAFLNHESLGASLAPQQLKLAPVTPPPLDNLEVTVPRPSGISGDTVTARLASLAREHAQRRDRKRGEAVALGDDVCVDIIGYAQGKLIPFGVTLDGWFEVSPSPHLPGFFEALVGEKVGDGLRLTLNLPESYPVASLRGTKAVFAVDLKAAREVRVPALEDPAFLKQVSRGGTLEEALQAAGAELEAELTEQLRLQAVNLVLDELTRRAHPQVVDALVDAEVRARWQAREKPLLESKGFTAQELTEALEGWLSDGPTRAEAARRLGIALTLRAVAERDQIHLTAEQLSKAAGRTVATLGVKATEHDVNEALETDPRVGNDLLHFAVVEHVMKHAKVHFQTR